MAEDLKKLSDNSQKSLYIHLNSVKQIIDDKTF